VSQGLPKEWQRLINESGIPEKERRENPQTMVDILQFYKETTERLPEDQVLEKFHHANGAPGMYPTSYMGMFPHNASPVSTRLPTVHDKGSFENPRAPPPVPPTPKGHGPTPSRDLQPNRPAPKPPVSMNNRALQQGGYPGKDSGIGMAHHGDDFSNNSQVQSKDYAMTPDEYRSRSRSNSRNAGPSPSSPYAHQGGQQSTAYQQQLMQQQQEQALAQAQAAMSPALARAPSKRQGPQPIPGTAPLSKGTPRTGDANGARNVQNDTHAQQAPAGANAQARPRPRQRQSNGMDVVASLKRICHDGDPREIFRGFTKIGQGASGGVFTGHERGTNRLVAIKQMNLEQQPKKDLIINEILVMKDSSHPNIVNFIESYLCGGELWVVMEFMEGGSLTDVVTFNIMTEGQIGSVCRETFKGLQHLHSKGVIHRDIKSDNILLSNEGSIKISEYHACPSATGPERFSNLV
jgi:p21-activated kinase 1